MHRDTRFYPVRRVGDCHCWLGYALPMTIDDTKPPLDKGPAPAANDPQSAGILRTIMVLTVFSFLVGAVLTILGLHPLDFWKGLGEGVKAFVEGILDLGWGAVSTILTYIIFGAMIVVPIWGVAKLFSLRKSR